METSINEKKEEMAQEQPTGDTGSGNKSPAASILDRADSIRKGLEEENRKAQELLEKNQELAARKILGGETEAGQRPAPVKEETPQEYAKRLSNGIY